jgi:DNA-binding transcriptional ArsR family regulator
MIALELDGADQVIERLRALPAPVRARLAAAVADEIRDRSGAEKMPVSPAHARLRDVAARS